jgi:hypothetical protein
MIVACLIYLRQGIVPSITIEIETLGILEFGIRHRVWLVSSFTVIRAHEPSHAGAVVSSPEVVES